VQASVGIYPINKLSIKTINGNVNEVGTSEDLVACLSNNILKVNEVALVA
jgi:hypothetical protein